MPKQERSSWDTESGLLDDYDFDVEEAWFGLDEEADSDDERIFLFLRGTATDDEGEEHEEHRERYSTGKNWEVVEDGAEVENATGKKRFNENAGLGRLINAFVALGDDEASYLAGRGESFESDTYEGLKLHMENRVVSKWTNDDGEEVEWRLNLPTSIKMKSKKKAASKKGGKGKADRSTTKKKTSDKDSDSGLRAEIATFAKEFEADEHDEFVDQVLDSDVFANADKIEDDDELHAEVLDPDSDLWNMAH